MEPPARDDNEFSPLLSEQQPKTSIPKTIGILNILFGSLLLLCGICWSLNLMMQSAMGPMMAMQQQQVQQALEAERQRKLQELQELENAAQDEKEKATLKAKQNALKAQPQPKMPDMTKFTQDVAFQGYAIADVVTGLVLNILMVVSGIGLVGLKEWGRRTAIWVAALKIVRLVALYGFFALAVVPVMVKQFTSMFQEMFEEMAKAAPPGQRIPGPAEMGQMGTVMGVMMTAFAIGMIIFGAIYPVIVLILLSRPRVKAACAHPASDLLRNEEQQL